MFAILFEVLLIEIQEDIHHFAGWEGGGLIGAKIVNKHFVNKLAFPNNMTPLPNRSTWAILVYPRKASPNHQNGVPKMNLPEFAGPRVSVEIVQNLNFPEFPGPSDFGLWGPHFQHFGGK